MRQARLSSPQAAISFTETILDATGAVIDLSAATLAAKAMAPDGTISSLTASGNSSGVLTVSGTLANQDGTHKIAAAVNGTIRLRREVNAISTAMDP